MWELLVANQVFVIVSVAVKNMIIMKIRLIFTFWDALDLSTELQKWQKYDEVETATNS